MPYGYTITTPLMGHDNLEQQADHLWRILDANNQAYAQVAQETIEDANTRRSKHIEDVIIPQPSKIIYLYRNKTGRIEIASVPVFVQMGDGLMEHMGVKIQRSPDNTDPYTPEQMERYSASATERVRENLSPQRKNVFVQQ